MDVSRMRPVRMALALVGALTAGCANRPIQSNQRPVPSNIARQGWSAVAQYVYRGANPQSWENVGTCLQNANGGRAALDANEERGFVARILDNREFEHVNVPAQNSCEALGRQQLASFINLTPTPVVVARLEASGTTPISLDAAAVRTALNGITLDTTTQFDRETHGFSVTYTPATNVFALVSPNPLRGITFPATIRLAIPATRDGDADTSHRISVELDVTVNAGPAAAPRAPRPPRHNDGGSTPVSPTPQPGPTEIIERP